MITTTLAAAGVSVTHTLLADPLATFAALGLFAGIGGAVRAFMQRRRMGADTTAVITAAALDLVQPLRTELAAERARVNQLRTELDDALNVATQLRRELAACRRETDRLRAERDADRRNHKTRPNQQPTKE